jgi:hypothetical protein
MSYLGGEECEVYELNMHTSPLIAVRLKLGEGWLDSDQVTAIYGIYQYNTGIRYIP